MGDSRIVELRAVGGESEPFIERDSVGLGIEDDFGEASTARVVQNGQHDQPPEPGTPISGHHSDALHLGGIALGQQPRTSGGV